MIQLKFNLALGFLLTAVLLGYLIRWAQEGVMQLIRWRLSEIRHFRSKQAKEDGEVDRILGAFREDLRAPVVKVKKGLRAFIQSTEPRDPEVVFGTVEREDGYRGRHRRGAVTLLPRRVPGKFLELEPVPEVVDIFA